MSRLEQDRQFWIHAASFPPDKTEVYPGHAEVQRLAYVKGKKVLEYGCGGGADSMSYLRYGAGHVTLCDIVQGNLDMAQHRIKTTFPDDGLKRTTYWQLKTSTALPEGPFDVINAHGVLHHIEEPVMHEVIAKLRSLVAVEGWLTAMFYTEHLRSRCDYIIAPKVAAGMAEDAAFGACTDGDGCIARAYTEAQGCALLEKAGWRVKSVSIYNNGDFRTFYAVPKGLA